MLKSVKVQQEIQRRTAKIKQKLNIAAEDVIELIWNQATANPNDLIEYRRGACRYCYGDNHLYQRTPAEYERDLERYLADNKRQARKGEADPDPCGAFFPMMGGVGFTPKRDPHPECPECFGEGVGYSFAKDTRKVPANVLALYAGVKETKDGLEIKMHPQHAARELIGRHKGIFADLLKANGEGEVGQSADYVLKKLSEGLPD